MGGCLWPDGFPDTAVYSAAERTGSGPVFQRQRARSTKQNEAGAFHVRGDRNASRFASRASAVLTSRYPSVNFTLGEFVRFPMSSRTRFLITAAFVCHLLLAPPLVTSQLLSPASCVHFSAKPAQYALCAERGRRHHQRDLPGKERFHLQIARERRDSLRRIHPSRR